MKRMKNQVKRWTAFALVMAMIFSVLTPVFAEDTYSVTLTGPASISGRPVYAYQFISGSVEDGTAELTDLAQEFFEQDGMLAKYGFESEDDVISGLSDLNAQQLKKLGADIKAFVADKTDQADGPSEFVRVGYGETEGEDETTTKQTSATITGLDEGWYAFVVPDAAEATETNQMLEVETILTVVNADMTIAMKSDLPEVDKTVYDEEDDEYVDSKETAPGQVHEFKLTSAVPFVADDEEVDGFAFVDTLTKGLEIVVKNEDNAEDENSEKYNVVDLDAETITNFVTVKLGGVVLDQTTTDEDGNKTVNYTITKDTEKENTFKVNLLNLETNFAQENAGKTLTVTYLARVTPDAWYDADGNLIGSAGIVATNETYVQYDHNDTTTFSSHDTVNLLNVSILIDKWTTTPSTVTYVNENGETVTITKERENNQYALYNVGFQLYKMDGTTKLYYHLTDEGKVEWVTQDKADTFYTNKDGQVQITKLNIPDIDATYYLEETNPPEGYARYTSPIALVVTNTGLMDDNRTPILTLTVDDQSSDAWAVSIQNEPEGWLPSTGSIGTYLFIAAGVALIIGATLLKKRPQSAK